MFGDVAARRQRSVLLGLLSLTLAGACAEAPPSTDPMEEANMATARRAMDEIWNKRNLAMIPEVYAADVVSYTNGVRDTLSAEAFVQGTLQQYPDARITIEEVIAKGDRVVTHWTWTATAVPATNEATLHGVSIHRYVDGKIVEDHSFYDVLGFTMATGATITPPAAPPATTTGQ